ncbi:MAG: enoyl-CoA hydratase/isomerase family protein [Elusimicrobiota bacterium]
MNAAEKTAGHDAGRLFIRRQDEGPVRVLLLDRPPSNTLNSAFLDEISREMDAAAAANSVRCVVLASANEKYFSAGLDLDELLSFPAGQRAELFKRLAQTHRKIAALPKPTLAAMRGCAFLGGFILALACDWRLLGAETGRVALSEVRLGISPGPLLIRIVFSLSGNPGLAKRLVMQGKMLKAQEALAAGLVDDVLPADGFMDGAMREAGRLAKLSPSAYAAIKKAAREAMVPDEDRLWRESFEELGRLLAGEDAREGLLAMKEKRKPKWE